jgi:hypothetical protein
MLLAGIALKTSFGERATKEEFLPLIKTLKFELPFT